MHFDAKYENAWFDNDGEQEGIATPLCHPKIFGHHCKFQVEWTQGRRIGTGGL